jgi:acylphosphatase
MLRPELVRLGKVSVYVKVFGLVHGVRFRASMAELAFQSGVSGWVKNVPDGSVEALLEGEEKDVTKVVEWANRGPSGARVDSVKVERQQVRNLRGFRIV